MHSLWFAVFAISVGAYSVQLGHPEQSWKRVQHRRLRSSDRVEAEAEAAAEGRRAAAPCPVPARARARAGAASSGSGGGPARAVPVQARPEARVESPVEVWRAALDSGSPAGDAGSATPARLGERLRSGGPSAHRATTWLRPHSGRGVSDRVSEFNHRTAGSRAVPLLLPDDAQHGRGRRRGLPVVDDDWEQPPLHRVSSWSRASPVPVPRSRTEHSSRAHSAAEHGSTRRRCQGRSWSCRCPAGVGLPLPAGTQIMLNMHFINTSSAPVSPQVKMNIL